MHGKSFTIINSHFSENFFSCFFISSLKSSDSKIDSPEIGMRKNVYFLLGRPTTWLMRFCTDWWRRQSASQLLDPSFRSVFRGSRYVGSVCFWPPGSGSVIYFVRIRIRPSTSKKRLRKTLISTVLSLLYDFLSLKNYVNVPFKKISIKLRKNNYFLLVS
jgi:hypothetical protein